MPLTETTIATAVTAFGRCAAFLYAMPFLGSVGTPGRIRVAVAAVLSVAVAFVRPPVSVDAIAVVLPLEILLGLAAGLALRLMFAAAESGGQLLGLSFGLGLASFFDPTSGESALVTRRLIATVAGLAFFVMGGLQEAMRILITAPVDSSTIAQAVPRLMAQASSVLAVAVRFAAPALLTALLINVGMALASRASPSLNIFSVMLSALLIAGGVTMIVSAPAMVYESGMLVTRSIAVMREVVGQ